MKYYICQTCGTQFPGTERPPAHCPICEDSRQYVGHDGQQWTTLPTLQSTHKNVFKEEERGLTSIITEPRFAIGQRALLVRAPSGNILWDCISLLDKATVEQIKAMGGISAIAISHPHFYSSMVEWSKVFNAPIYIHATNRKWVMRPNNAIIFWEGQNLELGEGLTLIRCGGHFPGGQVLHWARGAGGKGALLTGDIVNVVADRRYVSFMYSFPNLIPLRASVIRKIIGALEPFAYDRIYGGWPGAVVAKNAKEGVAFSAQRYIDAISEKTD